MTIPLEIDIAQVEELAARGLTMEQIATSLGVSDTTLYRRKATMKEVSEAIKRGKRRGVVTIANKLFEAAEAGNMAAVIFFLKTQGGWREKQQVELAGEITAKVKAEPLDEWFKRINADCLKLQSNTETGKSG